MTNKLEEFAEVVKPSILSRELARRAKGYIPLEVALEITGRIGGAIVYPVVSAAVKFNRVKRGSKY
jgi:hypothetical protein|tara:strand:+ start:493 stop:690 length:198 start_codon:yes stop_codon:yes gene_type:complete